MLDRVVRHRRVLTAVLLVSLLVGVIGYQPLDWGRADWSTPYIEVDTSRYPPGEGGTVLMLGYDPLSYVIPEFPASFRFVRPESNLAQEYAYGIYVRIAALVEESTAPLYFMYSQGDPTANLTRSLGQFNLTLAQIDCSLLSGNIPDEIYIFKVTP